MPGKVYRAIRERLHARDPRCHWCRRLTRLVQQSGGTLPDDAATVDHFRARPDPLRQKPPKGEPTHVLACASCNSKRGDQDPHVFGATRRGRHTRRFTKNDPQPLSVPIGVLFESLKSRPNPQGWQLEARP